MKTITFYSYKGGVGRSLILANIADRLSEFGRKVCLLDFDLEAPGLPIKFESYIDAGSIQKGIVDYLYDFSQKKKINNSIRDYCVEINMGYNRQDMILIPAGNHDAREYWEKLAAINWYEIIYKDPSIALKLFLDLKEKIKKEIDPDYLLIDSRTGISEMSGITLSLLADEVVLVAANNKENLNGAKKIISSLNKVENSINGKVPKITFVLSRVPFTDKTEDYTKELALVNQIKREFLEPFIDDVSVIHSDRELEENEKIKIASYKDDSVSQIAKDYLNVFEKITKDDLKEEELEKFNKIKLSETLFEKALSAELFPQKLDLISKAIALNNKNPFFYVYRGYLHQANKDYKNSILDLEKVLSMEEKVVEARVLLASVYSTINDFERAKQLLFETLKISPNHIGALGVLSVVYGKSKDYIKALETYNKIIQLNPFHAASYNGRAHIKRLQRDFHGALSDVYKAIEIDSELAIAYATLAEIQAELGNINDFYINLELSLRLGFDEMEDLIKKEPIYSNFLEEERFKKVAEKFNIAINAVI